MCTEMSMLQYESVIERTLPNKFETSMLVLFENLCPLIHLVYIYFYSWDRVVPENFILGDTEENRILMKQLSEATRKL